MSLKNLTIVTSVYPSPDYPAQGTFVQQFAMAIESLGINCNVVRPVSLIGTALRAHVPRIVYSQTPSGSSVRIDSPRFVSFGSGNAMRLWLTQLSFTSAVLRSLRGMPRPNAFYGHFICMGGLAAIKAGRRFKVPSFLASGESSLDSPYRLGHRRLRRELSSVTGIVSVSEARKFELLENELVREERIDVFPNGVDHSLFYPHNRTEMRRRLNLPLDRFMVVFVGHFIQRKGARRLATAVQGLENTSVLFIGAGSEPPNSSQALFQGMVPHEKLPQYLSAADIFVLPTLAEGSCNAILEAMSCGLPIVSSEGDFNAGVVTDDVGIRVPPLDISAIHSAIKLLRDRPDLRHEMAVAALSKSKKYNLFARAQKISIFMNSRIALSGG